MTGRRDALTEVAREQARGLLAEAVEEAKKLARAELVDKLRQAIVDEATAATAVASPTVELGSRDEDAERCLYAYAIADSADLDFTGLNGAGEALRCIDSDGLALVVADMAVSDLTDLPTDEITEDGALAQLARTHDEVVRVVAGQATVLPLRLGTAVADEDAARELLRRRGTGARQQLAELRGRREWGVQFMPDETEPAPPPQPAAESGTAYLAARRAALDAADRRNRDRSAAIDQAHEQLNAASSASVRRAANAHVLADLAYLVATSDEAAFQAELEQLAQPLATAGVSARVTGPWPPYSFVRSEGD